MRIVYSPRSLRDIELILSFIRKSSIKGSHSVSIAIEHTIELCARHPGTGMKTDVRRLYRQPVGKYRYTIFFRELADQPGIEIVRVTHSARVRNLRRVPD